MIETVIQKASLVGQVIEDLSYETLSSIRFEVELVSVKKSPRYKEGGFFVFPDLRPGEYTLRIFGERFQPQEYTVTVPIDALIFDSPPILDAFPIFDQPGDNELIVIVKNINGGSNKITFDPVILKKEIRKDVPVLASGFSTILAAELDVGKHTEAKLNSVAGLTVGSILRIVRDKSIRLKFDPYYLFSIELTHIFGKVALMDVPQFSIEGAQVRLTQVNSLDVVLNDVAGAKIATAGNGGTKAVLGAEKDVVTLTNQRGDYNFYFNRGQLSGDATLEAKFQGYQTQTSTISITESARNRADFELIRL